MKATNFVKNEFNIFMCFVAFPRHCSSVSSVSASYASRPEINPRIQHNLSWKIFPSSPDSRRASCVLLAKACTLDTGKLPLGDLLRSSVVK